MGFKCNIRTVSTFSLISQELFHHLKNFKWFMIADMCICLKILCMYVKGSMSKIVKCEKCYNCAGSPLYCVTFPLELSPCTDVLCFVVAMWACKSLEPLFATDTYVPALHTVHSASHWSRPWLKHRYFFTISSVKLHFRFGMSAARQCYRQPCVRLRALA